MTPVCLISDPRSVSFKFSYINSHGTSWPFLAKEVKNRLPGHETYLDLDSFYGLSLKLDSAADSPHLLMLFTKTGNEIFKILYIGNGPEIEIIANLGDIFMMKKRS